MEAIVIDGRKRFEELRRWGIVWFDEATQEYVGRAGDGEQVSLGTRGDEEIMYRYIANRPNPEDW